MEAGITLGLTVGYQTDMLTYFLPLGRGNGKNKQTNKKTSGSHSVSFLAEMLVACREGLTTTSVPKKKGGEDTRVSKTSAAADVE